MTTKWKSIETAPEDVLILLRKDFPGVETPMVVVGMVTSFKGKVHHLWNGPYDGVVNEFGRIGNSETFTHWLELKDLV